MSATDSLLTQDNAAHGGCSAVPCSRLAERWRQKAADLYIQAGRMGTGFSELPMLWRAVGNALEDCAKELEDAGKDDALRVSSVCRELRNENEQLRIIMAMWVEWTRTHGHTDHAHGLLVDSLRHLSSANAQAMAAADTNAPTAQ
jgi:hypothetical protein